MDLNLKDRVILLCYVSLFFAAISVYVFEFHWFSNTFNVKKLVWIAIIFGILLGFGIGFRFKKKDREELDNLKIFILTIFLVTAFSPLLFSLVNRCLSFQPVENQTFRFLEEKAYSKEIFGVVKDQNITPDGYYIFFIRNGKVERINSSRRLFEGVERGTNIQLPIKKGLLDFEIALLK